MYNISNKEGGSCLVHLVKADTIKISRNPTKVFTFRNTERFIDALTGHSSCVVYVGKNEGEEETEQWYAYFWEGEEKSRHDSSGYYEYRGRTTLPEGSLAILEMDSEYALGISLEVRTKEYMDYQKLFKEVKKRARAIMNIDRENEYADEDKFKYMNPDELRGVIEEMKREYSMLESRGEVEI